MSRSPASSSPRPGISTATSNSIGCSREANRCRQRRRSTTASCAPHLDHMTRAYWEGRDRSGRRHIEMLARGLYRYGLLGRFISGVHLLGRALGADPSIMLTARDSQEQRRDLRAHAGTAVPPPPGALAAQQPSSRCSASASRRRSIARLANGQSGRHGRRRRGAAGATRLRFRSRATTISPGRPSGDAMRREAEGALPPYLEPRQLRSHQGARRPRRRSPRQPHGAPGAAAGAEPRPLRAARRPGLDDGRRSHPALAAR